MLDREINSDRKRAVSAVGAAFGLLMPNFAHANELNWLKESVVNYWKSTTATQKVPTTGKVGDAIGGIIESGVDAHSAKDFLATRFDNPSDHVFKAGEIQKNSEAVAGIGCVGMSNAGCDIAKMAVKPFSAIGEFTNTSNRAIIESGRQKTFGKDMQALTRAYSTADKEYAAIKAEAARPIEDTATGTANFGKGFFVTIDRNIKAGVESLLEYGHQRYLASLEKTPSNLNEDCKTSGWSNSSCVTGEASQSENANSLWRYVGVDGAEACEPVNFSGKNWIDTLIKDEITSECKLTAKDFTSTQGSYTIQCVYQHEGCTQCVDITTSNVRSGGMAATTEIYKSNIVVRKDGENRILITRRDTRGDGSDGVFERCPR